jgi:hypothetical protein
MNATEAKPIVVDQSTGSSADAGAGALVLGIFAGVLAVSLAAPGAIVLGSALVGGTVGFVFGYRDEASA